MKISEKAKNALFLAVLCSVAYFAVYIARNILSAVTPQIVADGYTEEYVGRLSSVYFILYAFGQLINGAIGDRIKAKYMICVGLALAGVSNLVLPWIIGNEIGAIAVYGLTGFFLSMIYGPLTKIIAENTEPTYTMRCCLGYTFASFLGSPMAGVLATFLVWQSVFTVSSVVLVGMATLCFAVFTVFEKRKIIQYGRCVPEKKGIGNVKVLFKRQIVKFSLIAVLTGVVRTSVVFWLPTYLAQYLAFSTQAATSIFSVLTFAISMAPFLAVFVYERLKNDMDKTVLLAFVSAAVFFVLTYFIQAPALNIVFIGLAITSSNCAASMLYSKYCPSLRDTGMVSSVTGFLDFLSYMAAAFANTVFANAATAIGWGNLILVWLGLMLVGTLVALPYGKFVKNNKSV